MPDPAPLRVLVVDDQRAFRVAVRRLASHAPGLELAGEASSADESVALAEHLQPDLVLMDINLPDESGVRAASRVRAVAPEAMVILISTYRVEDLPPDAPRSGARAYLHKEHVTAASLHRIVEGHEARAVYFS